MAKKGCQLTRREWNYFMQAKTNDVLTKNETEFISAVECRDIDAVALLLESGAINVNCTGRRKKLPITALQLAAKNDDYHMINLLLSNGARTITRPSTFQKQRSILGHDNMLETYEALTSPAYLSAANSDPLATSMDLVNDIKGVTDENYEEMRKKVYKYSMEWLECCEDMNEVYTLMTGRDTDCMETTLPDTNTIISKAIESCHKEFIAHYKTQKIMKTIWRHRQPLWKEHSDSWSWWFLYVAYCLLMYVVLLPVLATAYIISPDCTVAKILDNPKAKYFTKMTSYLLFLVLIIVLNVQIAPNPNDPLSDMLVGLLMFLLIYDTAYIWAEIVELKSIGFKKYFTNYWNYIDLLIFVSFGSDISLRLLNCLDEIDDTLQVFWFTWTALILTLACLRFFEHMYLTNYLGHLLLLFTELKGDVTRFLVIFIYVVLAFAFGFYYLYEGVKDSVFNNLESSITSLILTIFGGDPSEELNFGATPDHNTKGYYAYPMYRYMGFLLFTMFGTLCMLVLLNICIAMMSDTYTQLRENIDTEWKFLRAKIWMNYISAPVLPAPYNIVPNVSIFKRLCMSCIKKTTSAEVETNDEMELALSLKEDKKQVLHYEQLINVLLVRYLLMKEIIKEEDIECSQATDDTDMTAGDTA
ncbi:short transient receptor potential channel 5-like [Saccoglossus kowalevskii]|uniref:Short transient receptor potential channel 5-like n=1 Tax=Saccoglossus kowalevskii TaxID=10224 RepID=A0ABM0GYL9_SACKO|nr:PREDICTED: short transient receptor potential channel 5-like [Saccoglossus kowalevskii]